MSRANVTYPIEKDGVIIASPVNEVMFKYYRNPDESLHTSAYLCAQSLEMYFTIYTTTLINALIDDRKMKVDKDMVIRGLESPFAMMVDNAFFVNNYNVISNAVLNELTRMNTAREVSGKDPLISNAMSLSKYEYISIIGGLVAGTITQRAMDIELRVIMTEQMDRAMDEIKKQMDKRQ